MQTKAGTVQTADKSEEKRELKMPASWPSWGGSRGSITFILFGKVRLPELRHARQQGGPLERTVSINLTYTSPLYINLTSLYIFMYFVIIQSNWMREREFKFLIDSERKSLSCLNCPELTLYLLLIVINLDKKIWAKRNELKLQRHTLNPPLKIFDLISFHSRLSVSSNYIMMTSLQRIGGLGYVQKVLTGHALQRAPFVWPVCVWVWHTHSGKATQIKAILFWAALWLCRHLTV